MRSKIGEVQTFTERARRAQIIDCVVELVAERGYAQASVGNIAERAGIAKSVVLYHFANKDELVGAVVTKVFLDGAAAMLPAIDAEPSAAGKLRAYITSNAAFIHAHRAEAMALLEISTSFRTAEGLRLDQAAAQATPEGPLARLDPVWIFELGQRTGEFRPFPARTMAVAMRSAVDGAVREWSRDAAFDVIAYCRELVTVFDLATRRDS